MECGVKEVSFNSCRNRNCPKCQHSAQQEWVESQMSKFLPVGYFHVVFTIPQELNTLVLQNQKLLYNGEIACFNEASKLALRSNFLSLVDTLYYKNWVVFCKKPLKSPGHVVRYLGRYTHRVAISNSRILAFDGQAVSFAWNDYKDNNKSKVMTLDAAEFSRRFLLHVLPDRFVKIRPHKSLEVLRRIVPPDSAMPRTALP